MSNIKKDSKRRALVIGGSLGGLFGANMLKKAGWQVDIFERSRHDLDSRGGGLVLQPDVVEVIRQSGIEIADKDLGIQSGNRIVYRPDGSIRYKQFAPQIQTSWSLIYGSMRQSFGDTHYHRGKSLVDIRQNWDDKTVTALFDDGTEESGDLLVGADGNGSKVRQLLWPNEKPTYAGYLAWRGLVPEDAMPPTARNGLHGDFGFSSNRGSHILGYLVPGEHNDTREGHRLYNWVWYRIIDDARLPEIMTDVDGRYRGFSIPEGKLASRWRDVVYAEAEELLPPAFREVVLATQAPFAQAIRDLTIESMVKGRVILLGDSAFIPRPHTAASTSKAAANALTLAEALESFPDDLERALSWWEPQQLRLGKYLSEKGIRAGDQLLFNRASAAVVA